MKIQAVLMSLMTALGAVAAVPGSFLLQTVVSDGSTIVSDREVSVRISLRRGSATAKNVYQETHSTATDGFGVVTVNVGEGKAVSGEFQTISWTGNELYAEVEIDKGEGYISAGVSRIASVPFAKASATSACLIMTSASGKRFNVTIDDDGKLVATPIAE